MLPYLLTHFHNSCLWETEKGYSSQAVAPVFYAFQLIGFMILTLSAPAPSSPS